MEGTAEASPAEVAFVMAESRAGGSVAENSVALTADGTLELEVMAEVGADSSKDARRSKLSMPKLFLGATRDDTDRLVCTVKFAAFRDDVGAEDCLSGG